MSIPTSVPFQILQGKVAEMFNFFCTSTYKPTPHEYEILADDLESLARKFRATASETKIQLAYKEGM